MNMVLSGTPIAYIKCHKLNNIYKKYFLYFCVDNSFFYRLIVNNVYTNIFRPP